MTVERRTTWPQAAELQQAADTLRAAAPEITGRLAGLADPVADWLEATANALAWLAPFREHEPGYPLWEVASKVAQTVNGEQQPAADGSEETHIVDYAAQTDAPECVDDCPGCEETRRG
ncbi:hypothetical protein ACL02U_11925 [Streptomyces sp. MS06]|uniref:hypothetical protein n=1 Tax=Streptomyces sp. MS06 TaxID=3385974 RepID=UPI0039A2178F